MFTENHPRINGPCCSSLCCSKISCISSQTPYLLSCIMCNFFFFKLWRKLFPFLGYSIFELACGSEMGWQRHANCINIELFLQWLLSGPVPHPGEGSQPYHCPSWPSPWLSCLCRWPRGPHTAPWLAGIWAPPAVGWFAHYSWMGVYFVEP